MEIVWKEEQMPQEWNSATTSPIYTKGVKRWSVKTTKEFHSSMQLAKLLYNWRLSILNPGDHQCSTCRGQSTTDQTFSLRKILEVL